MPGINTCRGGPPAPSAEAPPGFLPRAKPRGRPSIRPSSLPPPPARHPNRKNSNRESLRRVRAVNRLCDCREIDSARRDNEVINVTQTKQTRVWADDPARRYKTTHPNRELEALLQNPDYATRRLNLKNSNRESLRLETHLTQTKQTAEPHSNRELEALFQTSTSLRSPTRQKEPSSPRKLPRNPKNSTRFPSFLLRLKPTPILCFVGLTDDLNLTMLRLRRIKIERIPQLNSTFPNRKRPNVAQVFRPEALRPKLKPDSATLPQRMKGDPTGWNRRLVRKKGVGIDTKKDWHLYK